MVSEQRQHKNRDYSKFDEMSTETLKAILRLDSQLPDGEESDVDTIMYIMEVVTAREIENIKDNVSDVGTAWKVFNQKYRPYAGDGKSLYEDDTDVVNISKDIDSSPVKVPEHSTSRRSGRGLLRIACVAAAIIALMLIGTVTAYALGYDLWGTVAQWSKETFGFVSENEDSFENIRPAPTGETFTDLETSLNAYGITAPVVPQYVPDGFEQTEFYVEDMGANIFCSVYVNGNDTIIIEIVQNPNGVVSEYEKDSEEPEIYKVNGVEHYIMTNMGKYLVVWRTDLFEASISGLYSKEELIRMIDSIYME